MSVFWKAIARTIGLPCVLFASSVNAVAQEDARSEETEHPSAWMHPDQIKTLENVRRLNEFGPYSTAGGYDEGMEGSFEESVEQVEWVNLPEGDWLIKEIQRYRQECKNEIEKSMLMLQAKGSPTDRSKMESRLRSALAEYFVADIRCRVHELDQIKAKVAETEAKLEERLASQKEAVDLQLKIMLRDADGLGFFHREAKTNKRPDGFTRNDRLFSRSLPDIDTPRRIPGPPRIPLGVPSTLSRQTPNGNSR